MRGRWACTGKGLNGWARVTGERPIGAASCRKQNNRASCQPPSPPEEGTSVHGVPCAGGSRNELGALVQLQDLGQIREVEVRKACAPLGPGRLHCPRHCPAGHTRRANASSTGCGNTTHPPRAPAAHDPRDTCPRSGWQSRAATAASARHQRPFGQPQPLSNSAADPSAPRIQEHTIPSKGEWASPCQGVGRKLLCRGGMARKPICPTPPLPLLGRRAGRGVWAGAALPAVPGRGGPTPTYMAQNDPHVALIILTTHMRGKFFREKKFSGPKFVFRRLWWQHPSLHKTKGPARKPISGTPPPLLRRVPMPSPPRKAIFGLPCVGTAWAPRGHSFGAMWALRGYRSAYSVETTRDAPFPSGTDS